MTQDAATVNFVTHEGWGRLRLAVTLEGATLLTLALIASPLKHLADLPIVVQIIGPVHGLAFLFFLYVLVEAVAARMVGGLAALRLFVGAMVPFGGVINERWLAGKAKTARARLVDVGTAS